MEEPESSVRITEFAPPDELGDCVELMWEGDFNTFRQAGLRQKVIPNGYVELIIHLTDHHCNLLKNSCWSRSPDYTVIGMYTRPYEVHFSDLVQVFGVRFKPEGIYTLFDIPASEFGDSYEDMELVLGGEFRHVCARLRETPDTRRRLELTTGYLMNRLRNKTRDPGYLDMAARLIRSSPGDVRMVELPGRVYISQRQLEREFRRVFGVTPKFYTRMVRLNEAHRRLEEEGQFEFTRLAAECGYADQAHFIRDFRKFTGVNPTLFIREREQYIVNNAKSGG